MRLLSPRWIGASCGRSGPAHGGADYSAIAENSALPFLSKRKYVNALRVVLFLRWLLLSPVVDSTEDKQEAAQMTCKIERQVDEHHTTLRLIGHLQAEHLEALQAQMEDNGPRTVLDLDQVTLVDVEVVRFLGDCEAAGGRRRTGPNKCAKSVFSGAATPAHPRRRLEHHCDLFSQGPRRRWQARFGQRFDPCLCRDQGSNRDSCQELGCHSWAPGASA
jgi:hypothetical protein